jgi:class 3 adenylate cyclase
VVGAVECALELQRLAAEENAGTPAERRMEWRIGVHLGDVLIEGDDILGDGVNIAARLEGIASQVRFASPKTPFGKCAARSRSSLPTRASRT